VKSCPLRAIHGNAWASRAFSPGGLVTHSGRHAGRSTRGLVSRGIGMITAHASVTIRSMPTRSTWLRAATSQVRHDTATMPPTTVELRSDLQGATGTSRAIARAPRLLKTKGIVRTRVARVKAGPLLLTEATDPAR
jgi:hypothetical protein